MLKVTYLEEIDLTRKRKEEVEIRSEEVEKLEIYMKEDLVIPSYSIKDVVYDIKVAPRSDDYELVVLSRKEPNDSVIIACGLSLDQEIDPNNRIRFRICNPSSRSQMVYKDSLLAILT